MTRTLVFAAVILMTVFAQARRQTSWALHIDTQFDYTAFSEKYGADTNKDLYRLELNPNYTWKYEDNWRFYLRPQFVTDPGNNSESERYFFDLTEANLRYKKEAVTIQVGNNLFNWGVTDGFNPLDLINSRQYFDPLRSRKLGATSLIISQNFENWDYDLVYIPINRGAILPGENSRWLPRDIYLPETPSNDIVILLPNNISYRFLDRRTLDDALANNFAARFQWRGSVDLGISFYEGVAPFPLVRPAVTGTIIQVSPKQVIQADPLITLRTQNYRLRQGGLSLVANYREVLLKYAGSYSQSIGEDSHYPGISETVSFLPGWTQENIVGLEKTFNIGTHGLLVAILQHSFINTQKENDSNLSVTEIFRNAYMLGGRFSWGEVWSGSLLGLYNSTHASHFEEVSITRRVFDSWNISLGASFIQGSRETPLGVYEKNDSYSLSVSRSF